jgi:PAS domain S-box-containing protein
MEDRNKTKKQLINELEEFRQRIVGLEALKNEPEHVEEALRKSEERARRLAQENAIMAEIGRIISSTLDINEVYERFAEETHKLIQFDRITMNIINPGENSFVILYAAGPKVADRKVGNVVPLSGTATEWVKKNRSSLLILEENREEMMSRLPGLLPLFKAGFQSIMFIPLISKDQVIGMLTLQAAKQNAYTEVDLKLAERVSNQIAGAIANVQLFTERKQAEEALRTEKQRFQTVSENAPFGMAMIDQTGTYKYINPKFEELFGYNLNDIPDGKTWYSKAFPDPTYRRHAISVWINDDRLGSQKPGEKISRTFTVTCKDGTKKIIDILPVKLETGEYLTSFVDITLRKRAEDALQRSEEAATRLAQENAIVAEIGRIISSTLNIEEVYERFAEETRKLIPFDRIMINLADLKNNTITTAYITGVDVPDQRPGNITPTTGTATEEVVRTRSSLLIQEDNMDEVVSRFPRLLPTFQAGFRSLIFVPLISKDQVIGVLSFRSLVSKAYTDRDVRLAESIGTQIAGAIDNAQLFTERKLAEEELKKAYGALKATQAQLIQSEKMASIGQLAAGIAHEINNPAGFIISNLDILNKYIGRITPIFQRYVQLETSLAQYQIPELSHLTREIKDLRDHSAMDHILTDLPQIVSESLEGTHRIKKIVNDLRTFSHAEAIEPKYAFVNDLLDFSLNLIWNEIKHKAEVVKEYSDVPKLFCYPQQLRQVFLNILKNAVQAIEKRGKIIIKTYEKNNNIFIEIIDTGCGIPEELQNRIFEPFFTLKEVGKGTGLGLSIVYGIIKKHKGDITVKSKIGEGTNFIIKLPIGG